MTAAQKAAKEKFSKAIAYRSKTGVSLKEAFAHVYGKKVGAVKKKAAPKKKETIKKETVVSKMTEKQLQDALTKKLADKGISKDFLKNNFVFTKLESVSKKKSAPKKKAALKKVTGSHKDTKSHNVNIRVVSGISKVSFELINELKSANEKLIKWQKVLTLLNIEKTKVATSLKAVVAMDIKRVKDAIKEQKTHIQELKKNIK